ncbi:MAG: hypothetical protein GF368_03020 [Candidatus Aenigmarchaeota archaeon]|nr:hypothetical protein [Candidatus Aenigmarchaeota archaeon]
MTEFRERPKYRQPYSILRDPDIRLTRRYNPALAQRWVEKRHFEEKVRGRKRVRIRYP